MDLGKFGDFFSKSDRREVVLGVPRARKSELSEKTPELAFLGSSLTILKIWADFINGEKKLGPKMSGMGGCFRMIWQERFFKSGIALI